MPSPYMRTMAAIGPPGSGPDELWGQPAMQTAHFTNPEMRPTLVRRIPTPAHNHPSALSLPDKQAPHDYFTSSPEFPKFQAGWQWYPGVSLGGAFMYPQNGMGANGIPLPRLTPPTVQHFGAVAGRSVRMGVIDNARRSGTGSNLLLRIINPPTSRR